MTREEIRRELLVSAFFLEDGSWSGRISRYRGYAREKQGWPWLLENLRALSAEEYAQRAHEVACHIMQIAASRIPERLRSLAARGYTRDAECGDQLLKKIFAIQAEVEAKPQNLVSIEVSVNTSMGSIPVTLHIGTGHHFDQKHAEFHYKRWDYVVQGRVTPDAVEDFGFLVDVAYTKALLAERAREYKESLRIFTEHGIDPADFQSFLK